FHLREGSPCIDAGTGLDSIDASIADIGAYGGPLADPSPFPVPAPTLTDTSTTAPAATNIAVSWAANLAYLVTNTSNPGSYRLWYQLNSPGPPYQGTDAGGGTLPSPIDVGNVTQFVLADLAPTIGAPAAPELLAALPSNETVTLTWTSVANANGYEISYGVNSVDENTLAVGRVTEYAVTGLINNLTYTFAVTAQAQATYFITVSVRDSTPNANESVLSPESSISIGETLLSPRSNELSGVPEQVVPFPDLPDDCFVATAAFGAGWAAEVAALRDFRDRFLLSNGPGRTFTDWYYRAGPAYATYLHEHDGWKPAARAGLLPLVVFALFMLGSGTTLKLAMLTLFMVLGYSLLRRRKRRPVPAK
ncbi:MAG: fibronectin type III domain-containing protein, partial [Gammaproteobacteria bacterium]|nr:fibronectin type III domain-containing protein [Gammaproteobacteria bacterium]